MTTLYQTDLKINLPGDTLEKCSLALSDTGDIQTVTGTDKLNEQLIRAVVNEDTGLRSAINTTANTEKTLTALFNVILRNFRQNQINFVQAVDLDFNGYIFYRRAAGIDDAYSQVSADPITQRFVDTDLTNETLYEYGLTKRFRNAFETTYVDTYQIRPSRFSNKQVILVGNSSVAMSSDGEVVFYVAHNRNFKASELLDEILSIIVEQDPTEPRRYTIEVSVKDLRENVVYLSTAKMQASK